MKRLIAACVLALGMLSLGVMPASATPVTPSVHSHPFLAFISQTGTVNFNNFAVAVEGPAIGVPIGLGTLTSSQADGTSPFVEYFTASNGDRLYDNFPVQNVPQTNPCPTTLKGLPWLAYNVEDGLFTGGTGRFANTSNAQGSLHLKACLYLGAPDSSGIAPFYAIGTYYGTVSY
jgi:hypothetical protein